MAHWLCGKRRPRAFMLMISDEELVAWQRQPLPPLSVPLRLCVMFGDIFLFIAETGSRPLN